MTTIIGLFALLFFGSAAVLCVFSTWALCRYIYNEFIKTNYERNV